MKFKTVILPLIFLMLLHTKTVYGQSGEYFNHCSSAASLTCGPNRVNLSLTDPTMPPLQTNTSNHEVYFYLKITTPITTSFYFSGINMNPYSVRISQPLNSTLEQVCFTHPNGGPVGPDLLNYDGSGTVPYLSPVVTLQPGLYLIYTRYFYTGPSTSQPFYTFDVNLSCESELPPCIPLNIFNDYHPTFCSNQEICYITHPRICDMENLQNFVWDFGDGSQTITSCSWCHTYTTAGTYTLSLSGSGANCIASTQTAVVTVTNCVAPVCPEIRGTDLKIKSNCVSVGGEVPNDICITKCKRLEGTIITHNPDHLNYNISMNFGDGTTNQNYTVNGGQTNFFTHNYSSGTYTVIANLTGIENTCVNTYSFVIQIICEPPPCSDCIGSFAPIPGKKYILSAWIKEQGTPANTTSYSNAAINISYHTALTSQGGTQIGTTLIAKPRGLIIDGWQKIEEEFTIPLNAASLKIDLKPNVSIAFYDDIRVYPIDGNMKSFVYDIVTKRLVAELDERNYATLYEYDEEGKLIRVKKETERGIMTIKENRNSMPIKE